MIAIIIEINSRSGRPLHEQVRESIRMQIVHGLSGPDDRLPTVRELAAQLAINPNTIARAYRDLEQEGYIYTITGRGSFVSPKTDIDARRRGDLLEKWREISRELLFFGMQARELCAEIGQLAGQEVKYDTDA